MYFLTEYMERVEVATTVAVGQAHNIIKELITRAISCAI
jgi:hypothetical protein